jgi:hypothetical protein
MIRVPILIKVTFVFVVFVVVSISGKYPSKDDLLLNLGLESTWEGRV